MNKHRPLEDLLVEALAIPMGRERERWIATVCGDEGALELKLRRLLAAHQSAGSFMLQTVMIFSYFIFISHKISGPVHVMTQYLDKVQSGGNPDFRSLRKKDQLKDFHDKLVQTIKKLKNK